MKIFDLQSSHKNGDVKLSVSIQSERLGLKELWFSTPMKYEKYLCKTRMDGFLVGMLFPAMQYGENIHVNGCVSEKLLFNLNNFVVPLILTFSPSCKKITISAEETSANRLDGYGVGAGFSGGVDSFCTIYDHFELEQSPSHKINSFLFLNVGSHGGGEQEDRLEFAKKKFQVRYNYLKKFPEEIGLDLIPLDSNLHAFHPWGHQKTCTLTMVSGILLLEAFFKKYYCASLGWSYSEIFQYYKTDLDKDIAMFDPALLPLLSTESLDFIPDGWQYTRVDKTLRIINYAPVRKYLNVCVSGHDAMDNCSVCPKCCRTLMTLNSIGRLEQFKQVFDIDIYKKTKERRYIYEQMLLKNSDPFARGNIELAMQNGIKIPNFTFCRARIKMAFWADVIIDNAIKILKPIFSNAMLKRIK